MNSNDEDVKFLYLLSGSSDVLPPSCLKLRSYLNIHLSNLADQQNLQLLKSFRNRNKTCSYCYSSRSGDTTSLKLLPAKKFKTNKFQNKVNEEGNNKTPEANESRNTLVLKCRVCSKKSSFSLVKKKFVEEKVRGDNVESVKKHKKKRDMSCGLAINLIENNINSPVNTIVKKKKRVDEPENSTSVNSAYQLKVTPKSSPVPKTLATSANRNLVPNPFAGQGCSQGNKRNKKLERLKQAVKEEKSVAKKTLKDFLTLV